MWLELASVPTTNKPEWLLGEKTELPSQSVLPPTRRQLGCRWTTEAQKRLSTKKPFQPMQTLLHINSRMERKMWQGFTFSGGGTGQCATQARSRTRGPPECLPLRASPINWKSFMENRMCEAPTPAQAKGGSALSPLSLTRAKLTDQSGQQAWLCAPLGQKWDRRTEQAILISSRPLVPGSDKRRLNDQDRGCGGRDNCLRHRAGADLSSFPLKHHLRGRISS